MPRTLSIAVVLFVAVMLVPFVASSDGPPRSSIDAYFSPKGGCTKAIVREIDNAKSSIRVQAYSFTSKPIAEALVKAVRRDVRVEAILDSSNESDRYTAATFLTNVGAMVLTDGEHAIAHNKIIIIDDAVLITGSFNFSKAAEEKNAENVLVVKGYPELVRQYIANYDSHKLHSKPYAPAKPDEGKPEKRQPKGK